jgi:hypothetical protein
MRVYVAVQAKLPLGAPDRRHDSTLTLFGPAV